MDVDLNVLVPNHEQLSDVRKAAMGGKHQRSLSLSAKWASDKSMAIEYLRRQRDVMNWIETVLRRELPTTDLFELLKSGVVLREMMETLFPAASNCMSPISRSYSMRMGPWKERENISVFLRQCKSIGMNDLSLFCTDDLYEGTNMVQVLFCVQHFMMFSEERAGHLFKPIVKNEPAEFSNQELEMAMSKIGQGDANALKGLMSSVVPDKAAVHEKEGTVRAASEPASVPSMVEMFERVKDGQPAENEECPAEKVPVQTEVCNQLDDRQELDNPADDDDLNSEQESGTDVENDNTPEAAAKEEKDQVNEVMTQVAENLALEVKEEVAQSEIATISEQEAISVEEAPLVASASVQDVETLVVIEQLLLEMAEVIEVAETEAQMKTAQSISAVEAEPEEPSVEVINTPEEESTKEEDEVDDVMAQVTEHLALEVKGGSIDQTNIDVEVTEEVAKPAADSTDVPLESTPTEEAVSIEPVAETTEEAAGTVENRPQQTEEEELEAKAMAKCMCGRCTIM